VLGKLCYTDYREWKKFVFENLFPPLKFFLFFGSCVFV